ncbi:YfcE family phosphodiesterase [Halobacteriales archaeon SW_7_65_23]|nr:MAG: YfcE family phosphodiesterase [Halobacteriales archaeon SW_7_65_23]
MEVAIISDPHIPSRAQSIPEAFAERIREADHVIHAGDFDSKGAFDDQRDLAGEITAVHGNMDPDTVREHADAEKAVGVAGHTHEQVDKTHDGIRLLNPGSVTGAQPARETTMLTASVEDGDLDVSVHRL